MSDHHLGDSAIMRSERSIFDALDKEQARRAMLGEDALVELENQFQVKMVGVATENLQLAELAHIDFDVEFVIAPEQRNSPLLAPQIRDSAFVQSEIRDGDLDNPEGWVGFWPTITKWYTTNRNTIRGCDVVIGYMTVGDDVAFTGYVHLGFQGYGSQAEESSDLDVGS